MKPIWLSKTIVVNVIVLVAAVLQSQDVIAVVPDAAMKYVLVGQSLVNLILRLVTTTGVSVSGRPS